MNPTDLIVSYGFARAGQCSCGGTRNEIYKKYLNKVPYTLYYRKRNHTFKIKKRNEVVAPIQSLNNLETVLKQLFPDAVAVAEKV